MISMIIRTKNEVKWIKACLDFIQEQRFEEFEIVDNDSLDNALI